ncbi:MAG TPA: glycosyltransferase family 4 protein [Paracoccus sp.]|nr:glycosyltransferase family 4 protein [Paracoccus sp. (in: a-proteobacteria)]
MKIGYILNTYPSPSHSFIRREIRALERRGLAIHRLAMRPDDSPLPDPADREEAAVTEYARAQGALALVWALFLVGLAHPVRIYSALALAIRTGRRSEAGVLRHLMHYLEAAWVTRRAMELKLDRLHAHFGTDPATVAMLAQAMGAPPYSFTVHGPGEFDKPAAISLDQKAERADFVVAISSYGRSQISRWVPHRLWPCLHVVHCGIEPLTFAEPPPLPAARPLVLVSIGRFAEQKGQLLLLDAMAEAVRRGVDVRLVLIGDGEMRPLIERSITHHGLGRHVTLTGWLDEAGVLRELARAHGMVLPSFAEGLPMVLMEAMAAGRPAIATWVAGIPELMQHGKTGWLVPAGDCPALVEAITDMSMTTDARLGRMAKTARARALMRHDIDTEAGKLATLFNQRPRTQPD